jgi:hypothetical protein
MVLKLIFYYHKIDITFFVIFIAVFDHISFDSGLPHRNNFTLL